MSVRIQIVGGFLGAGKTTLITKIAKALADEGMRVGLIFNDQTDSLVDTQYGDALGLDCCEVAGGCFCCHFPEFLSNARKIVRDHEVPLILAEPVGSCTDLLATVVAPLKNLYGKEFQVAPLMIMVDAHRAKWEGIEGQSLGDYLRKHQVNEAEYIILSKSDLVTRNDLVSISNAIYKINSDAKVIHYSSKTGEGFDTIMEIVKSSEESNRVPIDIDYELYAQAEAELGWYNGTFKTVLEDKQDSYLLCRNVLERFTSNFLPEDIAHAKMMLISQTNAVKMSVVRDRISVDTARGSRYARGETTITFNARIISSPDKLAVIARESLEESLRSFGLPLLQIEDTCFSPLPPRPTYRFT